MGILDRDYTKEKMREIDPEEEKKTNWLLYLAIAIAIGFLVYYWIIK